MILVADSGSTKTTWVATDQHHTLCIVDTPGLNPHTTDPQLFADSCAKVVARLDHADFEHTQLFFYGAGCGTAKSQDQVAALLSHSFPGAHIQVEGDLLAACRALCGHRQGLVGILGTGSNLCFYDGTHIADSNPSLGFLVGDEGSANHIGKKLIKSFFDRSMPDDLRQLFALSFDLELPHVLDQLYHSPQPNRYLGSFAPFACHHRHHPFVEHLLNESFTDYCTYQIVPVARRQNCHTVSLVGSIAEIFQSEIAAALAPHSLTISKTLKEPILGLAEYHQDKQ